MSTTRAHRAAGVRSPVRYIRARHTFRRHHPQAGDPVFRRRPRWCR